MNVTTEKNPLQAEPHSAIGSESYSGVVSDPTHGAILSLRLIMKYFYGHSSPSPDSRRAVVKFKQKYVHSVPVNG